MVVSELHAIEHDVKFEGTRITLTSGKRFC